MELADAWDGAVLIMVKQFAGRCRSSKIAVLVVKLMLHQMTATARYLDDGMKRTHDPAVVFAQAPTCT